MSFCLMDGFKLTLEFRTMYIQANRTEVQLADFADWYAQNDKHLWGISGTSRSVCVFAWNA